MRFILRFRTEEEKMHAIVGYWTRKRRFVVVVVV